MFFFWFLLIYYSFLTIAGVIERLKINRKKSLDRFPSVAVLIPAHNEGVVIKETLDAMVKLTYEGI